MSEAVRLGRGVAAPRFFQMHLCTFAISERWDLSLREPAVAGGFGGWWCVNVFEYEKWIFPVIERFPKSQRFGLGGQLTTLSIELMDLVIEA